MKKILFTTTALVAATILTSAAEAAPKKTANTTKVTSIESTRYLQQNDMMGASVLKATVGGYANWYMGYADSKKDSGINEFDILGDAEVHFNVEAALKNGLKVGAKMQLTTDTEAADSRIDQTYMYLSGKMGKVMVGRHDNVSKQLSVHAIDVGALNIQETDFMKIVMPDVDDSLSSTKATYFTEDMFNTKVSYLTPNWNGFQAGMTYAPFGSITQTSFGDLNQIEATMLSAVYESKFDQVGFAVSAGYGFLNFKNLTNDREQFNLGARVLIKGFAISSAYKSIEIDNSQLDGSVFDIGVSYETGPYAFSVAYLKARSEGNDDTSNSTLLISGKYSMAAGVDAFATLGFGDYEVGAHNDGWAVVSGMMLSF